MPYFRLSDLRSGTAREYESAEVRVGRDPGLEFVITGEASHVVSGNHLRFFYRARHWWIEDMGSRNGTYVDERQLKPNEPEVILAGVIVRLGKTGPSIKVEAAASQALEPTHIEAAGEPAAPSAPLIEIVVVDMLSSKMYEASAPRVRIGRGVGCEIRPLGVDNELISRTHAEIYLRDDGTIVVRDARSVNGTFINGYFIEGEAPLKRNDQIALGEEGPVLRVKRLSLSRHSTAASGAKWARRVTMARIKLLAWAALIVVVIFAIGFLLLRWA